MKSQLPLFPESASSIAPQVDALFYAWTVISIFFTALIAALIVYFMVRYRRRHEDEVGLPERAPIWLEIAWSAIPLAIALAMFAWGTQVFIQIYRPPADAVRGESVTSCRSEGGIAMGLRQSLHRLRQYLTRGRRQQRPDKLRRRPQALPAPTG